MNLLEHFIGKIMVVKNFRYIEKLKFLIIKKLIIVKFQNNVCKDVISNISTKSKI
jgi:hypothetical protein